MRSIRAFEELSTKIPKALAEVSFSATSAFASGQKLSAMPAYWLPEARQRRHLDAAGLADVDAPEVVVPRLDVLDDEPLDRVRVDA
ncbi:hypothetical protein [Streptosporangium vulgare]|uniref:hypothetical protein n=1 Tax=Streptosporangium vulgare TaxID=46190 RepID=UPI0031D2FB10